MKPYDRLLYVRRNRLYVNSYLMKHPCEGCGETNLLFLDFHHRNPEYKYKTIAYMIHKPSGLKKIEEEIEKCMVLCCKCHRLMHNSPEVFE